MKQWIVLIILFLNGLVMNAQDKSVDPWTDYMTPSSVHKLFGKFTGKFTMEMIMQNGEMKFVVDSDHSMILGNRYLEMNQKGEMMGMDYQSVLVLGYNNIDKKISLTTITNMGTGTLYLTGSWNEQTQSAQLYGQLMNPVSKNIIKVRQLITFQNDDTIVIESFDTEGDASEQKTVEYRIVRVK